MFSPSKAATEPDGASIEGFAFSRKLCDIRGLTPMRLQAWPHFLRSRYSNCRYGDPRFSTPLLNQLQVTKESMSLRVVRLVKLEYLWVVMESRDGFGRDELHYCVYIEYTKEVRST